MYTTLVVALDLEPDGDRALPIVRELAELADVSIELLTVTPSREEMEVDAFELSQRATSSGWPAHSYEVIRSDDPAGAIVDHLRGRSDVLLVMATTAQRPAIGHVLGSVTERVLQLVEQPVLLVGPHVPSAFSLTRPTPIACVDPQDDPSVMVATVIRWMESFTSDDPWIVEVLPRANSGSIVGLVESAHAHRVSRELARAGVKAAWEVLHGRHPERPLEEFAHELEDPIFVTASTRWTDGRWHWHSVTRQLVHRSEHPVLVVPTKADHSVHPVDGAGDAASNAPQGRGERAFAPPAGSSVSTVTGG